MCTLSQESKLPCAVPATLRSITTAQLSLSGDHVIHHIACPINTTTCCQATPKKCDLGDCFLGHFFGSDYHGKKLNIWLFFPSSGG